jgi:transposase
MEDLYSFIEKVLDIKNPWKITDTYVKGEGAGKEIHTHIEVPFGSAVGCPECGRICRVHDRKERVWRNADAFAVRTYIHANVPRSDCPEHGIRQIDVPWARPGSGFTLLMESMIVSMVRQMPVKAVGDMIGEYDGRIWTVVHAYSEKLIGGLDLSNVKRVGVDEKCFSGHDSFITVFTDADEGRIIFVTEGKSKSAISEFRDFLHSHGGDKRNITDFSCDFGSAYISGIRKYFKRVRITADRFHLVKLANKALNDTKCKELKLSVNRMKARYLLLRNSSKLSPGDMELRDRICQDNETLGMAYRMKESLCSLYDLDDAYAATDHLTGWIGWAASSGLYHFKKLAGTVKRHMGHIVQWFTSRLTNAIAEGVNSLISVIKSRARGFRKTESLISMCYLVSAQEKTDMYGRGL